MRVQKRRVGSCKKRTLCAYLCRILVVCLVFVMASPFVVLADGEDDSLGKYWESPEGKTDVRGAKRWVDHGSEEYKAIYGDNASIGAASDDVDLYEGTYEADPGDFLSWMFGSFFGAIADALYNMFAGANIDLTIDGIVYGRLSDNQVRLSGEGTVTGVKMNLMHFGLERNNAWGIFGASLYFILRDRFALIVIPIIALVMVGKEAFRGGEKGRAGIKEVLKKLMAFFIIIYAVPYVVEAYIYIRDVTTVVVRDGMARSLNGLNGSYGGTGGIYESIKSSWEQLGRPFLFGVLMIGYACAGLVYFWDYIKIALLIATTFGLFPLILIWWFFKPKIVTEWLNLIIPGLLTPFIDMVLLLAPCFVAGMFNGVFGTTGIFTGTPLSIVLAMTLLACMWSMRVVRERVLKLFGFEGLRAGNGGLGLALAMLARGGIGKHGNDGGKVADDKPKGKAAEEEALAGAEDMRATDEVMRDADAAIERINSDGGSSYDSEGRSATDEFIEGQEEEGGSAVDSSRAEETVETADASEGEEVGESSREGVADTISDVMEAVEEGPDLSEVAKNATENVADSRLRASEEMASQTDGSGESSAAGEDERRARASGDDVVESASGEGKQESFADSLSDRDRKRYENLCQMDELQNRIARNEHAMAESGYSRAAYDSAVSEGKELSRRMDNLTQEKAQIAERRELLDKDLHNGVISASEHSKRADSLNRESDRNERSIKETASAQKANSEYVQSMESSYRADRQNAALRKELDARKAVESQYAYNSGLGGMSNRTYSNAKAFEHQKRVDEIKKRHMDYRNFDSKQYDGILSPAEREAKYRERAERLATERVHQNIVSVGSAVAKGVAGVVGVGALSFTGGGSMYAGGQVISGLAGEASKKVLTPTVEVVAEAAPKVVEAGKGFVRRIRSDSSPEQQEVVTTRTDVKRPVVHETVDVSEKRRRDEAFDERQRAGNAQKKPDLINKEIGERNRGATERGANPEE